MHPIKYIHNHYFVREPPHTHTHQKNYTLLAPVSTKEETLVLIPMPKKNGHESIPNLCNGPDRFITVLASGLFELVYIKPSEFPASSVSQSVLHILGLSAATGK